MGCPERWSAVVLAAGVGQRMGGVAKPLIRRNGQPLITHLVRSLQAAGVDDIVVVQGTHGPRIAVALAEPAEQGGVNFVAMDAGQEQTASLHQGLLRVRPASTAVMVCLADQPLVDQAVVARLIAAFETRDAGKDMLVPWVDGTPGNPVVFSRTAVQALLALGPQASGKAWRLQHPDRVQRMLSTDPAYGVDLDTLADLAHPAVAALKLELP